MDKKELLEMVNATISENGKREITGKALNLALTQIIEAMGESGGGAGGVTIYQTFSANDTDAWWDVSELVAKNAAAFAQLKALVEAGQPLPPIMVDQTYAFVAPGTEDHKVPPGVGLSSPAITVMLDSTGLMAGDGVAILLAEYINVTQQNIRLGLQETGETMSL